MSSDMGSVKAQRRDRLSTAASMQFPYTTRDGSSLVVTEDVELRVGTDLKSVWLVATPTASVITPMGKKKVTYSGTRAQIPFGSIQFDTRFKGPGMGGDMLARKSIPYHGAIETSIQKHQIPNGSYAHCRREYLKLLRDGFFKRGNANIDHTALESADTGYSTSKLAQRILMSQVTRNLSEHEGVRLEGDLHGIGIAGSGWRLPDKAARTAAMLLSVVKTNGDVAEGTVASTSQAAAFLKTFKDRYKSHAKSRNGDWADPASRFTAALTDTANSLYQQPMTRSQRQISLEGYSALCQSALNDPSKTPADLGDFYRQLQRVYQARIPSSSIELPPNKHPNQLKGDWNWNYRDPGEHMLDGISITGTDLGRWPDKAGHEVSRISLQPTDSQNQPRWLKLTAEPLRSSHNKNRSQSTRKRRRGKKGQSLIETSTEVPSVDPCGWLPLTQAPSQASRAI